MTFIEKGTLIFWNNKETKDSEGKVGKIRKIMMKIRVFIFSECKFLNATVFGSYCAKNYGIFQ